MRSHIVHLAIVTGLTCASMTAFAEPAVQAGETLESLSKAKVMTTVNGQPGSLNELLASGQIKVLPSPATSPATAIPAQPADVPAMTDDRAIQPPELQTEAPQAEPTEN